MASNTFALKEVLDFTVEKYSATGRGDVLFSVDYAGNTSVTVTAERLPIRGGIAGYKIIDLDHSKDAMYNAVLPIVDINALAVKLGKDVAKGATTAVKKEILKANASNKITLTATPLANSLKVYLLINERDLGAEQVAGTPASTPNTYSISGKEITLNATTAPLGTSIVVFYDYTTGANAQNVKITASDFPSFISISGIGLVDDDQAGQKVPVSFRIHKAKVQPSFELTMATTEATELEFMCDLYTIINTVGEREYVDIVKLNDEAF
jgi:hypothetical protein